MKGSQVGSDGRDGLGEALSRVHVLVSGEAWASNVGRRCREFMYWSAVKLGHRMKLEDDVTTWSTCIITQNYESTWCLMIIDLQHTHAHIEM